MIHIRRTTARVISASVLLVTVLAGCGIFSGKPGPRMAELASFKPSVEASVSWRYSIGSAGTAELSPAVVGKTVFAASADGRLVRLDDGHEVWKLDTRQPISGGVSSDGRYVAVGTRLGDLLVYSAQDGSLLWQARATSEIIASPVFTSQGILVRSGDNALALYALGDGKRVWLYTRVNPPLALRSTGAPVVAEPYAFVGFPGGKVTGVSLQNGGLVWEGAVSLPKGTTELERVADVVAPPLVEGRLVCSVAYQGRLACFDVANGGALIWARELSSVRGLSADTRFIYASDDRKSVLAFARESGQPAWKNDQFQLRQASAPLALPRRALVAVGDVEGYVHILSREDGTFAARVKTDGSPIVAPPQLLGNSTVLVQTRDGGLFAIEIQ